MAENDSGRTDTLASPSLASFVSDGWEEDVDESPETDDTDAGAPPADVDADTPDPAAGRSEGSDDAEHAGAPPADAASDDSDADPLTDFLADAKPLPYVVDGQERTFDGITYLGPDKGGFIPPEHMAKVQQRLSERDHLYETNRTQHEKYSGLEKLTSWQITNAEGKVETVTGAPALAAQRVSIARLGARTNALESLMKGEIDPASLVAWDEQGQRLVWDAQAWENFKERMDFQADKAAYTAYRYFEKMGAPAPEAPAAEAPVESFASSTVDQTAQQLGVQGLTPDDKAFLIEQFPRYVRDATPAEKQQFGSAKIVDASFGTLMKRTAASNTARAQAVSQASDISKKNTAKLAAAALGGKRTTTPRPVRPQPVIDQRQQDQADAWDLQENALAAGMRIHR